MNIACLIFFSGLGYIIGTEVASAFDNKWQWGLRVRSLTFVSN